MHPIQETRIIENISFTLIRKKIKHLYISIKPPHGTVMVSAPNWMTEDAITQAILRKREWILQKQATCQTRTIQSFPEIEKTHYAIGDNILLWGNSYPLTEPVTDLKEWYRMQVKNEIAKRLPIWEAQAGLYCTSWHVKAMKTRWGSCNVEAKRIWLNLYLIYYPLACLDYVILHELIHLNVRNHGKDFYALLSTYMPDWKERDQLLKNGIPK